MRILSTLAMLLVCVAALEAGDKHSRSRGTSAWASASCSCGSSCSCPSGACSSGQCPSAVKSTTTSTACDDALEEVNAARKAKGLKPFAPDPLLTQAAKKAAGLRAASRIAGHLASDFACLPEGARADSAGCAAWEPSWGWGACCTYDNYSHAGAAWALGSDGRRYMHLFVRNDGPAVAASQPTGEVISYGGGCANGQCSGRSRRR